MSITRLHRPALLALSLCFAQPILAETPPLTGSLKKIAESGSITLGYRDSSIPFSYVGDHSGKPMGYSVDLAAEIVKHLQAKLAVPQLKVRYNLVTSQTRIPLVQNGTVDLECGTTGVTAERQKQVDFSYGFIFVKGQLLTKKDSGIQGLDDLKGKNVVSTAGTTNEKYLKNYNLEHNLGASVISAKDHGEAFMMLQSGRAAAFYMDDALLYGERAKARNPHGWVVVGEAQSKEIYSCMVRKGDEGLLALVNEALADVYRSGRIEGIYNRWFQQPIPPNGLNLEFPMTSELKGLIARPSSEPVQ